MGFVLRYGYGGRGFSWFLDAALEYGRVPVRKRFVNKHENELPDLLQTLKGTLVRSEQEYCLDRFHVSFLESSLFELRTSGGGSTHGRGEKVAGGATLATPNAVITAAAPTTCGSCAEFSHSVTTVEQRKSICLLPYLA